MKTIDSTEEMTLYTQAVDLGVPGRLRANLSTHGCLRDHIGNPLTSQLYKLHGLRVVDVHGTLVGMVGWVWDDKATGQGEFIGVGMHWLRGTVRAIPAGGAHFDSRTSTIRLAYGKDQIKRARRFKIDRALTAQQKRGIRAHYDVEVAAAPGPRVVERLAA